MRRKTWPSTTPPPRMYDDEYAVLRRILVVRSDHDGSTSVKALVRKINIDKNSHVVPIPAERALRTFLYARRMFRETKCIL